MTDQLNRIALGGAGTTAEDVASKRRAKDAKRKRDERAKTKQEKEAAKNETEQEWWDQNRAGLSPSELSAFQQRDDFIRALLEAMDLLQGEDDELVQIIVEHVKENGSSHLGYIIKDSEIIPPNWPSLRYWQDRKILAALIAEGYPTEVYVRFGFLVAFPDWRVVRFLHKKVGWDWWKAAAVVGWMEKTSFPKYVVHR